MIALPKPGQRIAERYEVRATIKHGGMGTVYRARDLSCDRDCALKVMLPHLVDREQMRLRFRRESQEASGIESAFVVKTFDAGVDATGLPFIVMELLEGCELGELIAPGEPLAPIEALRLVAEIALGLDATHRNGIVHRDLKPENVFVIERGGLRSAKLLDFGIAKFTKEKSMTTGILGTPLYISPEQVHGELRVGPAADVYALAMIAYLLFASEPYWEEERERDDLYGLLTAIVRGPAASACERAAERTGVILPPAFDDWFAIATRRQPSERFASAGALAAALAQAVGLPWPRELPSAQSVAT